MWISTLISCPSNMCKPFNVFASLDIQLRILQVDVSKYLVIFIRKAKSVGDSALAQYVLGRLKLKYLEESDINSGVVYEWK